MIQLNMLEEDTDCQKREEPGCLSRSTNSCLRIFMHLYSIKA